MSILKQTTFIITRADRSVDPKTIIRQGLWIGRDPESDIWLNHETVSKLHAGISDIKGYFYLINLSASSATALNGRLIPFNEAAALTAGDELQIGPYFLNIDTGIATLKITVTAQFALAVGEREPRHKTETYKKQIAKSARIAPTPDVSSSLKIWWDHKRTREKANRLSPLHPQAPPRVGKIRFNWKPTRDLVRPWPFAIFIWAIAVIGTISAIAAVKYKIAFAPEPISVAHSSTSLTLTPAIAKQASGGACTSCHALGVSVTNKEKMSANCASCHQTPAFAPTMIKAHHEAGFACITCHGEHRGVNFSALNEGLTVCAKCHSDQNLKSYNGKTVHTPHGGTYGYPVLNGVWVWRGFEPERLAQKPVLVKFLQQNRADRSNEQQWRNAQFHGVHFERIRVVEGVDGVLDQNGTDKVLSCSSCHKTGYMGSNIDRTSPRTTCGRCHNTQVFERGKAASKTASPSCASCHVEHVTDHNWISHLVVNRDSGKNSFESAK